jgi:hypothetical protein
MSLLIRTQRMYDFHKLMYDKMCLTIGPSLVQYSVYILFTAEYLLSIA